MKRPEWLSIVVCVACVSFVIASYLSLTGCSATTRSAVRIDQHPAKEQQNAGAAEQPGDDPAELSGPRVPESPDREAVAAEVERIRAELQAQMQAAREGDGTQRGALVADLMKLADQHHKDGDQEAAIAVLRQAKAVDPNNEPVGWLIDTWEDEKHDKLARDYRDKHHPETKAVLLDVEEAKIPWHNQLRYPKDWLEMQAETSSKQQGVAGTRTAGGWYDTASPDELFRELDAQSTFFADCPANPGGDATFDAPLIYADGAGAQRDSLQTGDVSAGLAGEGRAGSGRGRSIQASGFDSITIQSSGETAYPLMSTTKTAWASTPSGDSSPIGEVERGDMDRYFNTKGTDVVFTLSPEGEVIVSEAPPASLTLEDFESAVFAFTVNSKNRDIEEWIGNGPAFDETLVGPDASETMVDTHADGLRIDLDGVDQATAGAEQFGYSPAVPTETVAIAEEPAESPADANAPVVDRLSALTRGTAAEATVAELMGSIDPENEFDIRMLEDLAGFIEETGAENVEVYHAKYLDADKLAETVESFRAAEMSEDNQEDGEDVAVDYALSQDHIVGEDGDDIFDAPLVYAESGDPDEELWIIQRVAFDHDSSDDTPGSGVLSARLDGQDKEIPLPLAHTDVHADIAGYIATVGVTQQFHNPYDEKIEAVYVFPLPQNAAVNEFVMTIGDRRIRGIVREREEAEQIYEAAKRQGHVASLMTQERPNIFTQSVANIEPGEDIDLDITYFHTLRYLDGWYEFVFPMVVGPRFNPRGTTDGIGAVARGSRRVSGQNVEIQYLAPGERTGHDISLSVDIDAGVSIEDIECATHVVKVDAPEPHLAEVELSRFDAIPNKDFVLRYKVAGERIKTALMTQPDEDGDYFTLMIHPPEDLSLLKRSPMEMIFVLDCSGSMRGQPIEQAKTAVKRALRRLQPGDTFQIIRFSNNASQLGDEPVEVTEDTVEEALAFVDSLHGSGGTMMIEGIKAALDFPHDPNRLRVVTFLTDGFIGNEATILGAVHDKLGASRIFSFGVGSSCNRYLLERMAKLGDGTAAFLGLHDDAGEVMDDYFDRISHPAMANIEIDWSGMEVSDVFPARVPDLFAGAPVVITGRMHNDASATVHLYGRAGDDAMEIELPVDLADETRPHKGISSVWARMKIADLEDRATWQHTHDLPGRIKQIALEHGLMSAYTAFVCVDSLSKTAGDHGTTVHVAVPVPEGVQYETTVTR